MNPALIVTFGKERYEIADPRAEWAFDSDGMPFCKSCNHELRFRFVPPDYWHPALVHCDHHSSHLMPSTP